jgi:hypothetical protein
MMFWSQDTGAATPLAAVIVFASMAEAIFLVPARSTLGTCFSRNHRARPASLVYVLVAAQNSTELTKALLE